MSVVRIGDAFPVRACVMTDDKQVLVLSLLF